jgi:hypothetical protein
VGRPRLGWHVPPRTTPPPNLGMCERWADAAFSIRQHVGWSVWAMERPASICRRCRETPFCPLQNGVCSVSERDPQMGPWWQYSPWSITPLIYNYFLGPSSFLTRIQYASISPLYKGPSRRRSGPIELITLVGIHAKGHVRSIHTCKVRYPKFSLLAFSLPTGQGRPGAGLEVP